MYSRELRANLVSRSSGRLEGPAVCRRNHGFIYDLRALSAFDWAAEFCSVRSGLQQADL